MYECVWWESTSEVSTRGNPELFTILGVISNPLIGSSSVSTVTFNRIDGSNGCPKPSAGGDDGVYVVHPEPEGGLKGNDRVIGHCLGGVDSVEPDALSGWTVVEIPCDLERPSPVVFLVWIARPL